MNLRGGFLRKSFSLHSTDEPLQKKSIKSCSFVVFLGFGAPFPISAAKIGRREVRLKEKLLRCHLNSRDGVIFSEAPDHLRSRRKKSTARL